MKEEFSPRKEYNRLKRISKKSFYNNIIQTKKYIDDYYKKTNDPSILIEHYKNINYLHYKFPDHAATILLGWLSAVIVLLISSKIVFDWSNIIKVIFGVSFSICVFSGLLYLVIIIFKETMSLFNEYYCFVEPYQIKVIEEKLHNEFGLDAEGKILADFHNKPYTKKCKVTKRFNNGTNCSLVVSRNINQNHNKKCSQYDMAL